MSERCDARFVGKEAHEQRDPQIRRGEHLQQQFGIALRERPIEIRERVYIQNVILVCDQRCVRTSGWDCRLSGAVLFVEEAVRIGLRCNYSRDSIGDSATCNPTHHISELHTSELTKGGSEFSSHAKGCEFRLAECRNMKTISRLVAPA